MWSAKKRKQCVITGRVRFIGVTENPSAPPSSPPSPPPGTTGLHYNIIIAAHICTTHANVSSQTRNYFNALTRVVYYYVVFMRIGKKNSTSVLLKRKKFVTVAYFCFRRLSRARNMRRPHDVNARHFIAISKSIRNICRIFFLKI